MTGIYEFESNPDRGFERFVKSSVILGPRILLNISINLDKYAREILEFYFKGEFRVYKATAQVSWKTEEDRQSCMAHEIKKGRWEQVGKYSRLMQSGNWRYSGILPVFIHPAAFNSPLNVLKPVDGARRIMAYLEANQHIIPIYVIRPWIPTDGQLMPGSQQWKL
jgi:hypothetical protein